MIEFQHPKLDEVLREVAGEHQFHADGRTLVVRGTCAECNRRPGREATTRDVRMRDVVPAGSGRTAGVSRLVSYMNPLVVSHPS